MGKWLCMIWLWGSALCAQAALPEFADIVEESAPAVVKILVEAAPKERAPQADLEQIPDYLRRFFERGMPPTPRERGGIGSGFVISSDGYIVTNNHVVEEATKVIVRMQDRSEFDAQVVGTDPRSDLALLKIDATGLKALRLATKENEVRVGEWVLAIGSPFGLDFSVTAGIVSAKGRSLPTENGENYVPFLQTDVAINPGNSGGPLFNLAGQVVGVNSQIFTRSGGSIGLSFAIPAHVVANVVEQIKTRGEVVRGWLGVSIQDVDRNLAESFGLDRPAGALIAQVGEGSPAQQSGLLAGDVILTFNDAVIQTSSDLPHVVGLLAPGTEVEAEILREGKRKTLNVTVGGLDADTASIAAVSGLNSDNRAGLTVETANADDMAALNLKGGVVVVDIVRDSPAAEAGVLKGDIITRVGDKVVYTVTDFHEALQTVPDNKSVVIRLMRGGSPLFIGLKIPSEEQ